MVNVRSQGEWAAFALPKRATICLIQSNMAPYEGPACEWAQHVLSHPQQPLPNGRFLAPLAYGLLIVDYDEKKASGISSYIGPFDLHLEVWESYTRSASEESQFVRRLADSGHLPVVTWPDGRRTAVGVPGPDVLQVARWLREEALRIDGHHYPPDEYGHRPSPRAPLHAPGWTFHDYINDRDTEAWSQAQAWLRFRKDLKADLSAAELEAWQEWATYEEDDTVLAALRAERLDDVVPAATPRSSARRRI